MRACVVCCRQKSYNLALLFGRVRFFKDIYGFGHNGAFGVVGYGAAGVS